MQQLTYEKNPNSSLPSRSPKNSADAQVVSCNPQEEPWESGDCFCSLKREGLQPERRRLTFEVAGGVREQVMEWTHSQAPRAWRLRKGKMFAGDMIWATGWGG